MKKSLKNPISLFAALCLIAGLSLAPVKAQAVDYGFNIEIASNAVLLLSLDTGEVIYEKNADVELHPASCTKIMSAALAMELCADLKGTVVTVPEGVWNEFDGLNVSTAGLVVGEELSMYDLICCMMLQSGNEAASAVRDYFGGQSFIDMMNAKAAELGCTGTHFSNPHGVFYADHYTTARDLSIITQWAMSVPGFWEISQLARYDKAATNKNEAVTLATTVLMQDPTSYYYTSYIKGIKTGTTDEAGRCLVSAAQKNGMSFLLVVLGGPFETDYRVWEQGGNSAFTDTRLIYDWAFENLELVNLVDESEAIAEIELKYARGKDALLVYPDTAVFAVLNKANTDYTVSYETELPESVSAPVESGQEIGSAAVLLDGREVGEASLVSRESVTLSRFVMTMDIIGELLSSTAAKIIYVIIFLIIIFYLWFALVATRRIKKNKKRRKSAAKAENGARSSSGNTSGSSSRKRRR
ncbi:MAG: D-alanyl-D-alanine carboxypeptidase family protein [Oscillospiraceae bacterium]|nr:D-alanyl-D-alanine carboxypeptidase family protein [Oscillospiraceae bacterium]